MAIASLILGILSFVTCGLTAIPAIICGHIALSKIGKAAGALGGRGMAIAGLIMGYLLIALVVLVFVVAIPAGMALPAFAQVQNRAQETKTTADLKIVGMACKLYALDHDGKFPKTLEELVPKYLSDETVLTGLKDPTGRAGGLEYFGGSESDPKDKILAATTPRKPGQRRLILHADNSVTTEKPENLPDPAP